MKKNLKKILIKKDKSIKKAIDILNTTSSRIVAVVNKNGGLIGTVTDGDIRRSLLKKVDINSKVFRIMQKKPIYALENTEDKQIIKLMKKHDIHHVPIVNKFLKVIDLKTLQSLAFPKMRENIVFIMAGGFGKRLMPLTKKIPKPMLKINDKPMLEVILSRFIDSNFKNFYISTHYKADKIINYFGNGSKWNVDIKYIYEKKPLGTAGSLSFLPKNIKKIPIVVINGDVIAKIDIQKIIEFHEKNENKITMAVRIFENKIPFGTVNLSNSKVESIKEKPITRHFVNTGIYVIDPSVLKNIKKNQSIDMTALIQNCINKKTKVGAYILHEDWTDVGRKEDYLKVNKLS
jgi:dTDP-glucose pyrophosphorylase/predicted transcriptional regulator